MDDKFIILEAACGCIVEKHIRSNKLPLFVIVGQDNGITESPFVVGNSDEYMAKTALSANCPHTCPDVDTIYHPLGKERLIKRADHTYQCPICKHLYTDIYGELEILETCWD